MRPSYLILLFSVPLWLNANVDTIPFSTSATISAHYNSLDEIERQYYQDHRFVSQGLIFIQSPNMSICLEREGKWVCWDLNPKGSLGQYHTPAPKWIDINGKGSKELVLTFPFRQPAMGIGHPYPQYNGSVTQIWDVDTRKCLLNVENHYSYSYRGNPSNINSLSNQPNRNAPPIGKCAISFNVIASEGKLQLQSKQRKGMEMNICQEPKLRMGTYNYSKTGWIWAGE